MIKEISNFVDSLSPELKDLGITPEEGIHVLIKLETRNNTLYLDKNSIKQVCYTKKAVESDSPFLNKCANLASIAWRISQNKSFDGSGNGIYSSSPYCVALKKKSLSGGEKYFKDKVKVYDRINAYFNTGLSFIDSEEEKERLNIFRNFLNSEDKFNAIISTFQELFNELRAEEFLIFYLDETIEKYKQFQELYLSDRLFNKEKYNKVIGEVTYGTSDFFNGFPTKKKFLTHQTAYFDVAGRISAKEARNLFDFNNMLKRNIFPCPLPIFIYQDEIIKKKVAVIAENERETIGYREIIESIYKKNENNIPNYYLLYYQRGEIKDFDFVSNFEYTLTDSTGKNWMVEDWFNLGSHFSIDNVFELQTKVLQPVFNNFLVKKTDVGKYQYNYFDELDAKNSKSAVNFLLVMKYRKAFYDFIYKSQRQTVTQKMFDYILLNNILEDIRLDRIENNQHTQHYSILQKMNIWFSLSEKFIINNQNKETMASKLQEHRDFIVRLTKGEVSIEHDDQYAFTAGQIIYYLFTKSNTSDRSYKRLEPFMQQVHAKELNKAIAHLFDMYKHENFSTNFRIPFAEVMDYQTDANMRDFIPVLLAGLFSENALRGIHNNSDEAEIESDENNND